MLLDWAIIRYKKKTAPAKHKVRTLKGAGGAVGRRPAGLGS